VPLVPRTVAVGVGVTVAPTIPPPGPAAVTVMGGPPAAPAGATKVRWSRLLHEL
jgi:hypothetical protein